MEVEGTGTPGGDLGRRQGSAHRSSSPPTPATSTTPRMSAVLPTPPATATAFTKASAPPDGADVLPAQLHTQSESHAAASSPSVPFARAALRFCRSAVHRASVSSTVEALGAVKLFGLAQGGGGGGGQVKRRHGRAAAASHPSCHSTAPASPLPSASWLPGALARRAQQSCTTLPRQD